MNKINIEKYLKKLCELFAEANGVEIKNISLTKKDEMFTKEEEKARKDGVSA